MATFNKPVLALSCLITVLLAAPAARVYADDSLPLAEQCELYSGYYEDGEGNWHPCEQDSDEQADRQFEQSLNDAQEADTTAPLEADGDNHDGN